MLNAAQFSAAKDMSETLALQKLAAESSGFKDFKSKAEDIVSINRDQWLRVEMDTCNRNAVMGEYWRKIEEDKDLYPYWEYKGMMDDKERDEHVALEGLIFRVGDAAGDAIFPPCDWNCRCTGEQVDAQEVKQKGKTISNGKDYLEKNDSETGEPYVNENFRYNPGKQVLPNDSSYSEVLPSANNLSSTMFQSSEKIEPFVEARSVKEAEAYAKDVLGVQYANFKGVDIDIANDMNRGLYNTKAFIPEFNINGIGNAQESNKAIKEDLKQFFRTTGYYKKYLEEDGIKFAEQTAENWANRKIPRLMQNEIAHSKEDLTYGWGNTKITLSKYKGVYINQNRAKSKEAIDRVIKRNVETGWFAKGGKDFGYIMNHELGHQIDHLLHISESDEFFEIFNREHSASVNELSQRLSKYGATAAGYRPHLKAEMIAEAWAEFVSAEHPRELATEIGTLITKTYHAAYLQETGIEYEEWMKKTFKIIAK